MASLLAANRPRFVVDGGYLSWSYGTMNRAQYWPEVAPSFSRFAGATIMVDSPQSWRKKYDASYKSVRADNKRNDPLVMKERAAVDQLVNEWFDDNRLYCIQAPGYEADDLVALWYQLSDGLIKKIVAVDKDIFQLPGATIESHSGERYTLAKFANRLPQRVRPYIRRARDVLVCLVLIGDRADEITRIVERGPRGLSFVRDMLHEAHPFTEARRVYGDQVERNLYLAALPGPAVYRDRPTPSELVTLADTGEYWNICDLSLVTQRLQDEYQRWRDDRRIRA